MPHLTRTGRADHDQIFRSHSIPPGEPYFVLRAQDAVSVATVRGYMQLAKDAGAEDAFLELAARQADAMEAWPKKKLPDADLEDHERKQLAYAWGWRNWNGGDGTAEAIAEARGYERGLQAAGRPGAIGQLLGSVIAVESHRTGSPRLTLHFRTNADLDQAFEAALASAGSAARRIGVGGAGTTTSGQEHLGGA